jgi:hypothetical protein
VEAVICDVCEDTQYTELSLLVPFFSSYVVSANTAWHERHILRDDVPSTGWRSAIDGGVTELRDNKGIVLVLLKDY